MKWFRAQDNKRNVTQVTIDITEGQPLEPKFRNLVLMGYDDLMWNSWYAGFCRISNGGPYLIVQANNSINQLRTCRLLVTYSFHRMPAGGLFAVFVSAPDSPQFKEASPTGHPVVDGTFGLDQEDRVAMYRDALKNSVIHLCFAEKGDQTVSVFGPRGSTEVRQPACRYDRVITVPEKCREILNQEFQELMSYHLSLRSAGQNYKLSMDQMFECFPAEDDPVLDESFAMSRDAATKLQHDIEAKRAEEVRRAEAAKRKEDAKLAEETRKHQIQAKRKASRLCMMCGKPLGFFQKLLGKEHHKGCNTFCGK
jgi:hypothetical protein